MNQNLLLHTPEGREFLLTPFGLYFIGRDRACDVSFPADTVMSSRHATVFFDGHHYYILDYKSRNGLAVNTVEKRSHRLQHGDCISIGTQTLHVVLDFDGRPNSPRLFEREEGDPLVSKLLMLNRAASALLLESDKKRLRKRCLRLSRDLLSCKRGVFVTTGSLPPFELQESSGFSVEPDIFQSWCLPALVHCHDKRVPLFSTIKTPAPGDPELVRPRDSRLDFDAYTVFPIRLESEEFGIIFLCRKPSEQPFSREEQYLLTPFVRYAALAFRSSYQLAEQHARDS